MKNVLLVIVGIIIGIMTISLYNLYKKPIKESQKQDEEKLFIPTEEDKYFYEEALEILRKNPNVSVGQGTRITGSEAERNIRDFKKTQAIIRQPLEAVGLVISTSYSFGLEEVDYLLRDIEKLNKLPEFDGNKKLTGIRVHLGENSMEVKGQDGSVRSIYYVDAFITPVDSLGRDIKVANNGISYEDIPDRNSPNIPRGVTNINLSTALNLSNPCPDLCPE